MPWAGSGEDFQLLSAALFRKIKFVFIMMFYPCPFLDGLAGGRGPTRIYFAFEGNLKKNACINLLFMYHCKNITSFWFQ